MGLIKDGHALLVHCALRSTAVWAATTSNGGNFGSACFLGWLDVKTAATGGVLADASAVDAALTLADGTSAVADGTSLNAGGGASSEVGVGSGAVNTGWSAVGEGTTFAADSGSESPLMNAISATKPTAPPPTTQTLRRRLLILSLTRGTSLAGTSS